jgi:glycosyltransferase involved in cell wall biosynthesis
VTALISVVVATYNRPDALEAVLRSLAAQTDREFEVLVADDGSRPDTAVVVAAWQGRLGRRVAHVWHPDNGFRLAEIRNRAILAAAGSYCVFLDGDCLARPNFIAAHRRLAEPGRFVTGNRILLSRALSEAILRDGLAAEHWSNAAWLRERLGGRINRLAALLSLPLGPLRKRQARAWRGARACNLGIWRADLVAVDGFDSGFAGWGREDSDLFVRLMRAGVRRKDGRFATGVLHLWHAEADRSQLAANDRRLADLLAGDRIAAQQGLSALREQPAAAKSGAATTAG